MGDRKRSETGRHHGVVPCQHWSGSQLKDRANLQAPPGNTAFTVIQRDSFFYEVVQIILPCPFGKSVLVSPNSAKGLPTIGPGAFVHCPRDIA